MLTIGYNTTNTTLLVDEAGFQIEGQFWGVIDTQDPIGRVELDAGRVLKVGDNAFDGVDPSHPRFDDMSAVAAALADRKARREAAEQLEKDELLEQVDNADQLPAGGDGVPHKDDLVDELVAETTAAGGDVPSPSAPAKKSTSRAAAKK